MSLSSQVDTTLPALGFVATESNADIVATSARQAHERGHAVFVIPENEGLLADGAGVASDREEGLGEGNVVVGGRDTTLDRDIPFASVLGQQRRINGFDDHSLQAALAAAAESHSLPGIVFYGPIDDPPDLEELPDTEQSAFVIDAVAPRSTRESLLVAVPAYNEAADIENVVRATRQYADTVLVVDDGSTDATSERAKAAGATVVRHHHNRGYGGALRTAFREAAKRGCDRLVTIDADGQHEPSDIPRLIEHQAETGAEVVIGSRFVDGALADVPRYRRVGLRVVNWLANLSLGLLGKDARVEDTQSGFRAYDRHAIESLADDHVIGTGMGASTDILYHASKNGYLIEEAPTTVYYHVENASTHNPFVHGFGLTRNLLRTIECDRPLSVLAAPGFVLTVGAFALVLWSISYSLDTGTILFNVALLAGIVGIAGGFMSLAGIVLYALNTHRGPA